MAVAADILLGAIFLGSPRFTMLEHVFGGLAAVSAAKAWRGYWIARDRHEAWRRRYRR